MLAVACPSALPFTFVLRLSALSMSIILVHGSSALLWTSISAVPLPRLFVPPSATPEPVLELSALLSLYAVLLPGLSTPLSPSAMPVLWSSAFPSFSALPVPASSAPPSPSAVPVFGLSAPPFLSAVPATYPLPFFT